ncbi:hypothetical protein V8C26DRAFT_426149 [Trichoderma gracile]
MWRDAADEEREKWTLRAEEEKESHGAKYPGYRVARVSKVTRLSKILAVLAVFSNTASTTRT